MDHIPVIPPAAVSGLHRTLARLAEGTRPILVGPWISEVGYEVLYWIPFLAWAQQTYDLDPDRLVVLSRGGCASWYAHLTARYLDAFSWVTPAEFARANLARVSRQPIKTLKHLSIGPFDRLLIAHATRQLGLALDVLHPSLMYTFFRTYRPWTAEWAAYQRPRPFRRVPRLPGLPARYVAARFYYSSICPLSPATTAQMRARLLEVLETEDVVLLEAGARCDDHADLQDIAAHPRLHRIRDAVTSATNLAVQTQVIAGASRFVGTYGGLSYLAPFLGVPVETVYGDLDALIKLRRHLGVLQGVIATNRGYGSFRVTSLASPEVAYA